MTGGNATVGNASGSISAECATLTVLLLGHSHYPLFLF